MDQVDHVIRPIGPRDAKRPRETEEVMSIENLEKLAQREIRVRWRSRLYLLGLSVAMLVVLAGLVAAM